jgi:AcrR family transcriptional regulator
VSVSDQWGLDEPVDGEVVGTDGKVLSARGERTRRGLLEAAERVFADLGYHDASIVKITEAAGVAQGTFYRYFESKQQIFDELVEDLNRRVRAAMAEGARQAATRTEAERLGFRAYFRFTADHPALYRIIRQAEFVSPGAMRLHYDRISSGYVAGLREAMAAGEIIDADPEVLAWALMGAGELIGMRWILWDERDELPPDVFEQLVGFIGRALGAPT